MSTQHTPGPWVIERQGPDGEDYVITSSATGQQVVCDGISRDYGVGSPDWHRCMADAQVIAAAPELLEALKIARDYAAYAQAEPNDLALIDAALAKAGGKS